MQRRNRPNRRKGPKADNSQYLWLLLSLYVETARESVGEKSELLNIS